MKCPICGEKTVCVSTVNEEPGVTLRVKKCKSCGYEFATEETIKCMAISLAKRRWEKANAELKTCTSCNNYRKCNKEVKIKARSNKYSCWTERIIEKKLPKYCCENCKFKTECEDEIKQIAENERYWCWC